MYTYYGVVTEVKDGDTVKVNLDLGFDIHFIIDLRILFLDTPETHTKNVVEKEAGLRAKSYLSSLLAMVHNHVVVKTDEFQTFNRWLGHMFLNYGAENEINIAKCMVQKGFEKEPTYDGKRARYFNAKRRAADLANAGVKEYIQ